MRTLRTVLVVGLGLGAAMAWAHEERLVTGRVERVDPAARRLVVTDAEQGRRVRLEVTPETDVLLCQAGRGLAAVRSGAPVRVTYLERAGGAPVAQSIVVWPERR
jgi:hypothetical protein